MPTTLIFLRLTLTRRRVPTKRVQMPMSDTSMMHACTMYHVEGRGAFRSYALEYGAPAAICEASERR